MLNQLAELSLRIEHRHTDGTWSSFERSHHDPADHDPERAWSKGQIYSCTACDEQIRVALVDDGPDTGPRGAA